MSEKKTVLLGVTGGIAAYKTAGLASLLGKKGYDVQVVMTENATKFISPTVFEALTKRRCVIETFDRNHEFKVEHISLAKQADVVMIAPATANVIGKLAHGIADDMLTTTVMACRTCPKIIAPAMNTEMYLNPVVQDNLKLLEKYGYEVIKPADGLLACGDVGVGKMPEPETLFEYIYHAVAYEKDLLGKHVLVTAGPTQESIDPVRFITNHSSGKMGYALARVCAARGADVTLISGPVNIEPPLFTRFIPVASAKEMFDAVKEESRQADIVCKAAAVADYRPKTVSDEKVKKSDGELFLEMERTDDILKYLGEHKSVNQFLCGFSMETENMVENSRAKLEKKNLDMIVANNLKEAGAGFQGNTNIITLITKDSETKLPLMSKEEAAAKMMDRILEEMQE